MSFRWRPPDMDTLVATFEHESCKAEVYEAAMPGQFLVRFYSAAGAIISEEPLTGVSSYKQRESEIVAQLQELCKGGTPQPGELSDAGEY